MSSDSNDIHRFPESFYFFSYICSHPSSLQIISKLFFLFFLIQNFVAVFTPLINQNQKKSQTESSALGQLYSILLNFSDYDFFVELNEGKTNVKLIVYGFILLLFFFFIWIHYRFYLSKFKFFRYFKQTVYLVVFPFPLLFLFPLITTLAQNLGAITISQPIISNIDLINIVFIVLMLMAIYALNYWLEPVYFNTPLFHISWMPSMMIPNGCFLKMQYNFYFIVMFTIIFNVSYSSIFFAVFTCIIGLFDLVNIIKSPFISLFDSALAVANSFHFIIGPIIICACTFSDKLFENQNIVFYGLIAFYFLIFLFSYFSKIFGYSSDILFEFQNAVNENRITQKTAEDLYHAFQEKNDMKYLFAFFYCKLILGEIEHTLLDQLSTLSNRGTLSWTDQFIIFELYKFSRRVSCKFEKTLNFSDFEKELESYKYSVDRFWTNIISGSVFKATKINLKLIERRKALSIQYVHYLSFFTQNATLNSFHDKYPFLNLADSSHEIDLFDRYRMASLKINIVDPKHRIIQTSSGAISSTSSEEVDSENQTKKIVQNITKFANNRKTPCPYIAFIVLSIFLVIASLSFLSRPFISLQNTTKRFKNYPDSVGRETFIGLDWGTFDYVVSHMIGCSNWIDLSCYDIMKIINSNFSEPPSIYCNTVQVLSRSIDQIARSMYVNIQRFPLEISQIGSKEYRDLIEQEWLYPKIDLFPYSTDPFLKGYKVDTLSLMTNYISKVIHKSNSSVHPCVNPAILAFDRASFFSNTYNLMKNLIYCMDVSTKFTKSLLNDKVANWNEFDFIFLSVFVTFSIIIITALYFASIYHEFSLMKKYFRPLNHPNEKIITNFNENPDKFEIRPESMILTFILLLVFTAALIQNVFILKKTQKYYTDTLKYCNFLSQFGGHFLMMMSLFAAIYRKIQFPEDSIVSANFEDLFSNIQVSLTKLFDTFSELKNSEEVRAVLGDTCNGTYDYSMHDIMTCWSIVRQLTFWGYSAGLYIKSEDPNSQETLFFSLQHLFLTHILPTGRDIISRIINITLVNYQCVKFNTSLELILLSLTGIFCCILFLVKFVHMLSRYNQLLSYLYCLHPTFVAKNQCLFDCLVDLGPEEERRNKEKQKGDRLIRQFQASSDFMTLFESSNIMLLVLSSHLHILAGTNNLFTAFGYRPEQLIGQIIEILIPKSISSSNYNANKFYQQIELLKRSKSSNSLSRWVVGRCSDSSNIYLIAHFSVSKFSKHRYIVIEFKLMTDELNYEDLVISHSELFNELYKSAMPVQLFGTDPLSKVPKTKTFERSVALFISLPLIDKDLSQYKDFEELKTLQEFSLSYFNGGNENAIVVSCSCSYSLIIFVSEKKDEKNDDGYILNALDFASRFQATNPYDTIGALFSCGSMKAVLFPPPNIISGDKKEKLVSNEDEFLVPSMTVEPLTSAFSLLPKLATLFQNQSLVVTNDLLPHIKYLTTHKLENEFGLDLSRMLFEYDEEQLFNDEQFQF